MTIPRFRPLREGPSKDNRVMLELHGVTPEQIERLQRAFRKDEHVHLADLFGGDVWKVLSSTREVRFPGHTELHLHALRVGFVPESTDKFGNCTG